MNYSYSTNILVRLLIINMKNFLNYSQNPKMCDPILVTLVKMQPHYSQSGFFLLTSQPNQQRLRLITLTTTLIIPDITKTESNDFFFIIHFVLVTFRVALHYVRRDNYHLFMSCEVVELGLFYGTSLPRDLWRFVEMVFLLRVYSLEIECALCSMRLCVFFALLSTKQFDIALGNHALRATTN